MIEKYGANKYHINRISLVKKDKLLYTDRNQQNVKILAFDFNWYIHQLVEVCLIDWVSYPWQQHILVLLIVQFSMKQYGVKTSKNDRFWSPFFITLNWSFQNRLTEVELPFNASLVNHTSFVNKIRNPQIMKIE